MKNICLFLFLTFSSFADPCLDSLKKKEEKLIEYIRESLSFDLLKKEWQEIFLETRESSGINSKVLGHCYHASEALYHLLGGKKAGLKPVSMKISGLSHWFLIDSKGVVLDVTHDQFEETIDYSLGTGRGFMTKGPSKRAKIIIERVKKLEDEALN